MKDSNGVNSNPNSSNGNNLVKIFAMVFLKEITVQNIPLLYILVFGSSLKGGLRRIKQKVLCTMVLCGVNFNPGHLHLVAGGR